VKSTGVVDANVVLRYLLDDHPEHSRKARQFFDDVRNGHRNAYVAESVIVECVHVLRKVYGVPRPEVAGKLTAVLRYKGVRGDRIAMLLRSLSLFGGRNVDITDAIVQSVADDEGWHVVSFDADFRKLP
jgi:predicted nucleic-acid-binding protein